MNLPDGIVTFLFTDIEGSSKLWEQHPEEMRAALAEHDAILRLAIGAHNGFVFKAAGDAFCAVFAHAPDSLHAVLASQLRLQTLPPIAPGHPLKVRMALHAGEAHQRDNDYFGVTLNRVSRLLAVAHGGQTLLSDAACALIGDALPPDADLADLGKHRLRDLQQPEHIRMLRHPQLPAEFPPLNSLPLLSRLPIQTSSFIGRESEMAEIKQRLANTRLLTLTGAGGCGKTRLALQAAADLQEAYPEGVWLTELAALSDAAFVPQAVASALGLREDSSHPLMQTLSDYLASKTSLLLLDNCEHLIEASARLASALLRACPQIRILATSREPLNIVGETVWRVPSLLLPDPHAITSPENLSGSALYDYDSVRLFVERARLHRSDFTLDAQNGPAVAEVCRRLDGIPLAIELAAARVRSLSAAQIAARLDNRFALLTGGDRAALPRQQTLRALIDWSYDLLHDREKTLQRRLSVFAGGWTLEAAEAVCTEIEEGARIEKEEVLDLLTSLTDKSLAYFDMEEGTGGRYRLLETMRQYGMEHLVRTDEERTIRQRHRDYFLALAEEAALQLTGANQATWLTRLSAEHENLRAALAWSHSEEEGAIAALRLTAALWRFWLMRCYPSEGRAHLTEALKHPGAAERTSIRARALNGAGVLALQQSDYGVARAHFEESLAISQERGDKRSIAQTLNNLASMAYEHSDYGLARALHEESLAIKRELGDKPGIAISLNNLGNVATEQGEYERARALHEESLAIKRELGNQWGVSQSLNNLGIIAGHLRDYDTARALHRESLTIKRALGDTIGIASSLGNLGVLALNQEDFETAKAYYEECLTIQRNLGEKRGMAATLNALGTISQSQGDRQAARTLLAESLTIRLEIEDKQGIAGTLESFARLAQEEEQPERAARLWGATETLRKDLVSSRTPVSQEDETALNAVRAALGEEAFAIAWAGGQALSPEQAVAYALANPTP